MKVRVAHDGPYGDWTWECPVHRHQLTTDNWKDCYTSALGHLAMEHPRKEEP